MPTEAKQEKLVQLYYQDLVTEKVFAAEQAKLKTERRAARRLRSTAIAQLDDVQDALDLALSRVERPYEVYYDGTPLERRIMNRAIFERIEIGPDAEVTGTKLTPVYEALSAWKPGLGQPRPKTQASRCSDFVRPDTAGIYWFGLSRRPAKAGPLLEKRQRRGAKRGERKTGDLRGVGRDAVARR